MVKILITLDTSRTWPEFETNSLELIMLIITEWWSVLWKKSLEFIHDYFSITSKQTTEKKSVVENFDFLTESKPDFSL